MAGRTGSKRNKPFFDRPGEVFCIVSGGCSGTLVISLAKFRKAATFLIREENFVPEKIKDGEGTIQGRGGKGADAKKVGVSSGLGALLGVLTGGGKGAKVGAAVGAASGLAGVLMTRGSDVVLYPETQLTIRLDKPASYTGTLVRRNP